MCCSAIGSVSDKDSEPPDGNFSVEFPHLKAWEKIAAVQGGVEVLEGPIEPKEGIHRVASVHGGDGVWQRAGGCRNHTELCAWGDET